MKKSVIILAIVLLTVLGVFGVASAKTGSAVIPHYTTHTYSSTDRVRTLIYVSNITDQPIAVEMTCYQNDGTILKGAGTYINGVDVLNFADSTNGSVTFTLDAHQTGLIILQDGNQFKGYGTIEWSQDSDAVYGLVAHGYGAYQVTGNDGRYAIPINNGEPF